MRVGEPGLARGMPANLLAGIRGVNPASGLPAAARYLCGSEIACKSKWPIRWPVWRKLARPKPLSPSPRVYAALGSAAVIGIAVFLIWWFTAAALPRNDAGSMGAHESVPANPPSKEAIIESDLPRGGSLTGSTDGTGLAVDRLTSAALVRVNRSTDELEPWLAESWTSSPDNLVYTVKLRAGVASVTGAALTAAEAARSLGSIAVLGQPVAIREIDPLTLEVRFPAPFAPGLRLLDRHPISGFGPFVEDAAARRRTGWRTFRRNPNYWRKAANGSALPYLDEIVLLPSPAQPGQYDFADSPITADEFEAVKKIEQSGKARLFELGPGLDADALWFAPSPPGAAERPWLTNEALRLAISMAADRRQYCKQVFYGACDPMAGPVSPANLAWFNPDFPLGPANTELARAKLVELGLRDRNSDGILDDAALRPLRFSLLIRRDVPSAARAAQYLADTLKGIGVQMDVTPLGADVLAARRQKGNYDAMYDRIEIHDTDPALNLDFWLSSGTAHVWSTAPADPAQAKRAPFDWERQIDALMLKSAATFDRAGRLQAFVDAQKLYLQHLPAIFFGTPHVRIATSMRTLNATPSPLRPHVLWNAENLAALK